MADKEKRICSKCGRELDQSLNFYTYKNGQKFEQCKSCLTMHIDNWDPDTYLWILQKADVPYVPQEWEAIRSKAYAKNPLKINGMSVLGKYLSLMKLKQWNKYTWADTKLLQDDYNKKLAVKKEQQEIQNELVKQQYENGEISEAQYRTLTSTTFQKEHDKMPYSLDPVGSDNMYNEKDFLSEEELPDLGKDLTLQEKQFLALKWGRTYKVTEWIQLEKIYTEMMNSFDIQDADSKNTLIFICKTNLKMNQAIDCGDVEGYQKLSRVYDALRKSAKFTAAQKKDKDGEAVDSVGQLVAYCQRKGHAIPRYEIKEDYDKIDKIIKDLKNYTKTLIYEDTALARQIQDYIKQAKAILENKKDQEEAKKKGLDHHELSDQDIMDFKDFINKQKNDTAKEMEGIEET